MFLFQKTTLRSLLVSATLLTSAAAFVAPLPAFAQTDVAPEAAISCAVAPPVLPVYAQPPMPEAGYMWTPGYWAWSAAGAYYWVPGTWVLPPVADVLWTPPYWGWSAGLYIFHAGYWGPHVGFYGGVNYGYGYGGSGFQGGRWEGGHFAYNRNVTNVGSVHVEHSYRQNVTVNNGSRVSYNGGTGGIRAEANRAEQDADHETHRPGTEEQSRHVGAAAVHPGLVASHNNGRPQIAATSHAARFEGRGVVAPRQVAMTRRAAPQVHAAARPAQHAAPRPQQRAEARPQQREAPRPQQHAEARPQQHAEARHEGGRR